ncbi:tryptophan synthase subunit alpha [Siphonobacter sp. BAB-5385]|uniref:tryptophan synthase subunit alpha n=1 Tax=Siphonobacter sp. BAB-5385 TaxID=1864822 RepID=UPI000B9E5E2A|nr:tryptophan synthase subunit alpha [Siphonobacter sp. BAB-5385]OZI06064.1 tryptophan synthase subunit alpha [Siphonobacter sp. BAB-5385]
MNRITQLFQQQSQKLLNVYFTAGYPQLNDTRTILKNLQEAGADLVEIGMPYSDPVADGETIQASNQRALENGMSLKVLFSQLEGMRDEIHVPVLLMGYINPVLQFGVEAFCQKCQEVGVDGLILPDIPADVYEEEFKPTFEKYGLLNIFLITPQTTEKRIQYIDEVSQGFIYMVSSASITGAKTGISAEQEAYFDRIASLNLKNPRLIGFGISDNQSFEQASKNANGAIIGSAFIKAISQSSDLPSTIQTFVQGIKGPVTII